MLNFTRAEKSYIVRDCVIAVNDAPDAIPERIAERIRREAEKQGLAPEEDILEAITRDLDPDERTREYIEPASALLEQAKGEL